jgi:hypothetical protein
MKFKGHPEIASDVYKFKEPHEDEEEDEDSGMSIDIYDLLYM